MKKKALLFGLFFLTASCVMLANPVFSSADFTENTWVSKTPMNEARIGLGVAVVNGRIYALGGYQGSGPYLDTNEEYDPVKDRWAFREPMPTPMAYFGVAAYQNKIYCIDSKNGATEVYDPATDTWESKASLPHPRVGITANSVAGKIYIIGGTSNIVDVYDPATDSWTTKASMPASLVLSSGWSCASVVVDGKIHVIGATPRSNSHQIYDPETDSWSVGESLIAGYWFASVGATTGVNSPKRIYVFGADSNLWTLSPPTLTSQSYDLKTNTWTTCAGVPAGHLNAGVAVVDDKLYVIGGGGAGYANAIYPNALNSLYKPVGYGTPDPFYVPPDTTAPEVTVLSPANRTYSIVDVPLTFTVSEQVSWLRYSLDGRNATEVSGNVTLAGLDYGVHKLTVYATDAAGNTGVSGTVFFTIAEPEPFPTTLVAAASVVSATIIGVGILVYFKKRKH
jgi:N-acetylneuraminic acid mutarotase